MRVVGAVEVLGLPEPVEPPAGYHRCTAGEHPDRDEYRAVMVEQGESLIRVAPECWGPVATGGVPARPAESEQRAPSRECGGVDASRE